MTTPVVYSMMFNGIFPCFEGFNQFAMWPATKKVVSFFLSFSEKIDKTWNIFQDQTYYTLLSEKKIVDPHLQRSSVTLPFYEGYQYVAFPAKNSDQVIKGKYDISLDIYPSFL